eukprot:3921407-Heterocapsa_arctica.AAC.1
MSICFKLTKSCAMVGSPACSAEQFEPIMSPRIYLSSVKGAAYRAVGGVEETHAKLVLKLTFPIH